MPKYSEYPKQIRKSLKKRDKKRRAEGEKGGKKRRKVLPAVLITFAALIVCAAVAVFAVWKAGSRNMNTQPDFDIEVGDIGLDDGTSPVIHDSSRIIEYKGQTYEYNEDIVTVALLGVDKENLGLDYGVVGTGGQADTIALAVYDMKTGSINVIVIPRDTMAEVNTYDVGGGFVDIKQLQICTAYAYGDGKKSSCENTMRSINRMLLGIPVDRFFAMDMNGIPALNDAVGGVTLTCLETEGRFTKGETVTLYGDDADAYVRDRNMKELDSDTNRRARQKQYMQAFLEKVMSQIKKDFTLVPKLYNKAMKYVVTDITLDNVTYLAGTALSNEIGIRDYKTIPGEYRQGEKYAEYVVDKTALFEMILDVFYTKAEQ